MPSYSPTQILKKYLSYIYPIIEYQTKGDLHEVIEVTWTNGKLLLNTEKANYSFGSSYHIFVDGFYKFKFQINPSDHVLILGFGVGSVKHILEKKYNFKGKITGVEFDKKVIELGYSHFNVPTSSKNLTIIYADALNFVIENKKQFEIIVIDIFIELEVPSKFLEELFFSHLKNSLLKNGTIFFNIAEAGPDKSTLNKIQNTLLKVGLKHQVFETKHFGTTNYVLKITA